MDAVPWVAAFAGKTRPAYRPLPAPLPSSQARGLVDEVFGYRNLVRHSFLPQIGPFETSGRAAGVEKVVAPHDFRFLSRLGNRTCQKVRDACRQWSVRNQMRVTACDRESHPDHAGLFAATWKGFLATNAYSVGFERPTLAGRVAARER
jgi:hypothetical protein